MTVENMPTGLSVPRSIGWAAIGLGVSGLVAGVGIYFDMTYRIGNLTARVAAIEARDLPTQAFQTQVQTQLARMEAQLAILLGERPRPYTGPMP